MGLQTVPAIGPRKTYVSRSISTVPYRIQSDSDGHASDVYLRGKRTTASQIHPNSVKKITRNLFVSMIERSSRNTYPVNLQLKYD